MSAGIRARRVVDPMPVQRAPYPQHDHSLTGISNAWNNIAEAKRVLQNAEARLEDAEFHRAPSMTPMSQDVHPSPPHHYTMPSDYSRGELADYSQQGSRVPVDAVPSLKIGNNKTSRHDREKQHKKVTIVDVPTPRDKYHHAQSTHPHRQSSTALTMNNYQPRPHSHPSHKQYNDPQLQRIENSMASRGAPVRQPLYEDPLLRTQLREQERRAALLRTLNRPADYQRPSNFTSPPHGEHTQSSHKMSPSIHAILHNGPTNLSIDNSTEIRVLNDIPLPQSQDSHPSTSSTHRQSAKHRTQNNYMSAYERLYGSQPGDKIYESQYGGHESHKRSNESKHLERLREKIEHQKSSLANDPLARTWHRDDDPVVVSGHQRQTNFDTSPMKAPVRKVASAPAPPAYKGFNEAETRFRMPDGSIISEDRTVRKTTRKRSSKSTKDKVHSDSSNRNRALQPSRSQPRQKPDSRTSRATTSGGNKPIRKVQKISETKKPKKPIRNGIISTTSWRDGQKAVLKVLGPAPKIQKPTPQSPPTKDTETSESVGRPASKGQQPKSDEEKEDEEEEELSQHTIPSDKEDGDEGGEEGGESPVPNVDRLPSEAKDILEDLHLEESDAESDKDMPKDNIKKEQKQQKTVKAPQKTRSNRNQKEPEPAKRVRHYNANDVQKYMAKQRADRKRKMQEEKQQRQEAEERKREQLEVLFKKQKESAKHTQRVVKDDQQRFDETFSKDPPTSVPLDTHVPRQRPAHTGFKRLDVTSSDKENKGVYSTSSSSDSSLRSSPQTDGSHEMPLHLPIHGESGRETMEVMMTRITGDGGKANGDHHNVPATIVEEDAAEAMDTSPPADQNIAVERPPVPTRTDAWTQPQPRPVPSSTSKPRSKAERLQALKATASALQGKIDNEVRKLASDSAAKLRSPDRPTAESPHADEKWAYPAPIGMTMDGAVPADNKRDRHVRFPTDERDEELPSTRYERLVGSDNDYRVFTGSLPGVGNLSEQAGLARIGNQESHAATTIQAAYRGHSVRQSLDWRLPSGATLKDKIQGKVPQIHVSSVNEGLDSTHTSPYSSGGEAGDSEGETLSEGPISEEGSNLHYAPKYKQAVPGKISLRQRPQGSATSIEGLNNARNNKVAGILGSRTTPSWDRSLNDGLSVINIYTKKYQEANKGQRVYHGKLPATAAAAAASGRDNRTKSHTGYSFDEDFGQKAASSTTSQYQSSSATEGSSPVREMLTRDSRSLGGPTESISYENDFTGSGRSTSIKPDAKVSLSDDKHYQSSSATEGSSPVREMLTRDSRSLGGPTESISYENDFTGSGRSTSIKPDAKVSLSDDKHYQSSSATEGSSPVREMLTRDSRSLGGPTESISYENDFTGSGRSTSIKPDAKVSLGDKKHYQSSSATEGSSPVSEMLTRDSRSLGGPTESISYENDFTGSGRSTSIKPDAKVSLSDNKHYQASCATEGSSPVREMLTRDSRSLGGPTESISYENDFTGSGRSTSIKPDAKVSLSDDKHYQSSSATEGSSPVREMLTRDSRSLGGPTESISYENDFTGSGRSTSIKPDAKVSLSDDKHYQSSSATEGSSPVREMLTRDSRSLGGPTESIYENDFTGSGRSTSIKPDAKVSLSDNKHYQSSSATEGSSPVREMLTRDSRSLGGPTESISYENDFTGSGRSTSIKPDAKVSLSDDKHYQSSSATEGSSPVSQMLTRDSRSLGGPTESISYENDFTGSGRSTSIKPDAKVSLSDDKHYQSSSATEGSSPVSEMLTRDSRSLGGPTESISYENDFTGSGRSTSIKPDAKVSLSDDKHYQSSSATEGSSPVREMLTRDSRSLGGPTESISYENDFTGSGRSTSIKPDAKVSLSDDKHYQSSSATEGSSPVREMLTRDSRSLGGHTESISYENDFTGSGRSTSIKPDAKVSLSDNKHYQSSSATEGSSPVREMLTRDSRSLGGPTESISYENDFTGSGRSTSIKPDAKVSLGDKKQYQSSSATEGSSPVREMLTRDSRSLGGPTESISYENDFTGSGRSTSIKPDAKASAASSHHSKLSSRHGRRSPLGGASDNGQIKSDADKTLNSFKSDEFESSSSDEEPPAPRKRPLRTPSPRLRKARTSSKSPHSMRSSPSSKSSSQSPTSDVRKSPPREKLSPSLAGSSSRRSPHSRSKSPRSQSLSHSPPAPPKSPATLSHFRPIPSSSDEGGLRERRQEGMGVERPQPRAATTQTVPPMSNIGRQVPPAYFSPGALELKLASELNLLESLEVSVRQLSDLERTRAVSLAQQESVSLARILQSRQRDHERELQLLSLKARQEVEDANKQLEQVKQRAVATANEAERALVDVRKEAADSNNETARRLMESQAEAARVTAEAAKQLAEAQASASQQAPIPVFDAGKMATDTATAAASAAVVAAMEQQRQHQLEMLQELRNASVPQPIGTSTRNLGGSDLPSAGSHGDYSSSFTSPSKSTSRVASYSEDFTDTATQHKTRSPKSASSNSLSSKGVTTAVDESQESIPSHHLPVSNSVKTASDLSINSALSSKSDGSIRTQSGVSEDRDAPPKSDHSSIQTESGADPLMSTGSASVAEDLPDESVKSVDYSISFDGTESDVSKFSDASSEKSSVVSSVITRSKSKDADKKKSESSEDRPARDDSFSKLSEEMLRQQLRDEEVRAQQQAALFKLREKALTDKTRAQLQLLEHEKRRLKEKGDEEGLQAIKRQQKLLLTKLQQEQNEIHRLKSAQRAASRERQLLLFQQQQVSRMRKEAQEVKGRMKDLPDVSLSSSVECLASEDDVSIDSFDGSSNLPMVLSDSNMSLEKKESARPLSAAEKQAQVMQKLKKLQQPLSMKQLSKREQKLTRRRKNVEELLAWKQRLDEEEKMITNMEEEALHVVEGPKQLKDSKKADSRPQSAETQSSPRSPPSEVHSEPGRTMSSVSGRTVSSMSEGKSVSEKRSKLSEVEGHGSVRDSESSIAEDLSQASSIVEEIPSIKTPQKSSTTSHTITEPSSDDTLKNDSPKNKYANESFESADRTLTPTKSSTQSPISASTPKSALHDSTMTPSLLSQRRRHESESGSESERSFSQTMSETASDQSDIEGRVRALKDALRKRKMEAERLRKQQKRMNREKLKAQEASLKKQLEAYDQLIEKTKAELKSESEHPTPSASSVKPKIKQPRVSESQRLRDQSHAKSLRQRAVSETSREGIPDVALRKQRSGSEGSISSRSSFDEDAVTPARDAHTPASSVSTPPTTPRHTEDISSPIHKTPSPLHRDRSISSSSSIRQPSDSYKTPSPVRSQHSFEEDKSRPHSAASSDIPEDVQSQSSVSITPDVSMKEIVTPKAKGDNEASVSERPAVVTQVSVDEPAAKSEASDVPEDIVSVASSKSSDQEKLVPGVVQDKKDTADDEQSRSVLSEKSALVSEAGDDMSYSFSGSGKSLSRHSRQRSDKSDISYSDDFNESSVSIDIQNQDAKSETDDDISKHLSMASEPSEKSSGQSQELLLNLRNKTPEKIDESQEEVPSVMVSVAKDEEKVDLEEEKKEEVEEKLPADLPQEEPITDTLAEFKIGDRVLVGGVKPGVLRFKGPTHFASGFWGGVELDDDQGSNNGTYGNETYFACKPKHGIFAPPEKLSLLPAEKKTVPESDNESSVAEEISVAEDINSEASVHTASKSESSVRTASKSDASVRTASKSDASVRTASKSDASERTASKNDGVTADTPQQTPRSGYSEDFENEDVQEEKGIMEEEEPLKPETSESSISRRSPGKSHSMGDKNGEDTDEDSIAEEIADEAALEKLIHSTALAVESFSKDEEEKPEDEVEAETPRGPPEPEVAISSKEQLVDSITDHLTEMVVKDSVQAVAEVAGPLVQKQPSDGKTTEAKDTEADDEKSVSDDNRSSGGLLEILAGDEVLPEATPKEDEEEEVEVELPKTAKKDENVIEKVDNITSLLLREAISDMLKLKKQRSEKVLASSKSLESDDYVELEQSGAPERTSESDAPVKELQGEDLVTPPNQEPPEPRAETPFTPDDSPVHRPTSISPPLSDELFQSRVQVESSPDDQGQVARPGSPVLGESSLLNPEALSERLEQLQTLDQDMGDLFGDQEWFDDDFGSMPKSKSIIQVPVRTKDGKDDKTSPPDSGATTPADARRLDVLKFADEPFYAVPHSRKDVESLVDKSVGVFYDRVQLGENDDDFTNISPPPSIMGDDTKASDIESTSKKAYKKLVFDLAGEVYNEIVTEQKPTVQPPWMKPKRQPRRYFFDQPLKSRDEIGSAIQDRVLNVTSLDEKPKAESAMSKFGKKKKDHVDEILTQELREEEPEWVDYDKDELSVKMQLADAIFDSLLIDTAMALSRIQDKRKARHRPVYDDDDDLEF